MKTTLITTSLAILLLSSGSLTTSAADPLPGAEARPASYFYTGKPYDADLESYAFAFRNYSATNNRWTTSDPSGFPDGANNNSYAPVPNTQFDPSGLAVSWIAQEGSYSPNPTYGALPPTTFSWQIAYNHDTVPGMFGEYSGTFKDVYQHAASVGFVTWRGLTTSDFGSVQTLTLYSRDSDGAWSPNGWTVSASFLEQANAPDSQLANVNQRLKPIGASTSRDTLRGLSSYLYNYLNANGAGYNGDLFYE